MPKLNYTMRGRHFYFYNCTDNIIKESAILTTSQCIAQGCDLIIIEDLLGKSIKTKIGCWLIQIAAKNYFRTYTCVG